MISVTEAKNLIRHTVQELEPVSCPISGACGKVLSSGVNAPVDMPHFDQAAMDGYAYSTKGRKTGSMKIIGESAAGRPFKGRVIPGTAVRIYTGAAVPEGADTVIVRESTVEKEGYLLIKGALPDRGSNIRKTGAQMKKGRLALRAGSLLSPAAVSFLAAMGLHRVSVVPMPRVSVIVTGDELKEPGTALGPGQVYECNSFALAAALHSLHISPVRLVRVPDRRDPIGKELGKAMRDSDLVLISGGISMGNYDFTGKVLETLGIRPVFYKVKQKPGKPLLFAKRGTTFFLALPGNPAAALACFYEYAVPAIRIMQGKRPVFPGQLKMRLKNPVRKKKGISLFLKGKAEGAAVKVLDGQESFVMESFARANCLIYLPGGISAAGKGSMVEVHLLPGLEP